MEELKVHNYSNVFIASYFTDNCECSHANSEHTLLYLCSGELEIDQYGKKSILHQNECAFMRRDNRMLLQKRVKEGVPYRSIVLKFSRDFLRMFYQKLDKNKLPRYAQRDKSSLYMLPAGRPDIKSLFESILPYFDSTVQPAEEVLQLKMVEGLYILLNTDINLYASLFDFVDPWKIDLMDFMEHNYMNDLSLEEMAGYTGRSLSTFKRDFKKYSNLSPQKWIIKRRLEAAYEQLSSKKKKVSEVCMDVGFKNLSHFSRIYKEMYGLTPTEMLVE